MSKKSRDTEGRVVDQDVQMPELRLDRVDGGIGRSPVAHVEGGRGGLAAVGFDLGLPWCERGGVPAVQHHGGAGLGQALRHGEPEAARGAGDEGHAAVQRKGRGHGRCSRCRGGVQPPM
jgi:hypothetical protein